MIKHNLIHKIKISLVLSLLITPLFFNSITPIYAQDEQAIQTQENDLSNPSEEDILPELIVEETMSLVVGESKDIVIDEASTISLNLIDFEISTNSPKDIISLSGKRVKALKVGNAVVDILSKANGDVLASVQVSVKALEGTLSIEAASTALNRGASLQLSLKISDSLVGKPVVWESSNPKAVSVDSQGLLKAVQLGEATITASIGDFSAQMSFKVSAPLTKVDFNGDRIDLSMNDVEAIPALIFVPYDTTSSRQAVYSSTDDTIFKIEDGQLVAVGVGEAELIAVVSGIETRIEVVVSPVKNPEGAEVLVLNHYEVIDGELVFKVDHLGLFVSQKIALEFDEAILMKALETHQTGRIRVVLPSRLNDKNMAVLSSFIINKEVFEGLQTDHLEIKLVGSDYKTIIKYRFDKTMGKVNLKFALQEILPEHVLYPKIQTKSYQLQFFNGLGTPEFEVELPGRNIATKSGQLHFLYTLEDDKLVDTYQHILSDDLNAVGFKVSHDQHVLTFNKIAVISNNGLLVTLGGILIVLLGVGVTKGYKAYRK